MDLIDKEKTLHDLITFLRQKCAGADTRIFFGILEVVGKQKAWLKLHGNLQYRGAVLAPCPMCGSFEVEVTTRRISDPDSIYYNHFEGRFQCVACGNVFMVRTPTMQQVFAEWNRWFAEAANKKEVKDDGRKMY